MHNPSGLYPQHEFRLQELERKRKLNSDPAYQNWLKVLKKSLADHWQANGAFPHPCVFGWPYKANLDLLHTSIELELRARLEQTQQEVEFLRGELIHRRKTDEALGSVIEAFRLNSEVNQSQALKEGERDHDGDWRSSPRHDIVRNPTQGDEL